MPGAWKYELDRDLIYLTRLECPLLFNRWLSTELHSVTVRKGYHHDGCTWAIDWYVTRRGSIVHDAGYQFAEQIAIENGKTVREVLRWADELFLDVMLHDVRRNSGLMAMAWDTAVAHVYYGAVRMFGYRYHELARSILGPAELRTHRLSLRGVTRIGV